MPGEPLYNSRITSTYLKLLKLKYPLVDTSAILEYAGMEPYQVADEGHWFSQDQINRFHERLVELTGNDNIAKEAGFFTASPEVMGGIRRYLLCLANPAKAYALVGKYTGKFTRSSKYESRKIGHNKIEFLVTPNEGVTETPFQCKARLGYIEAIAKMFEYKLPQIEHPECMFENGTACRYIVSWHDSPFARWQKIKNLIALPLIISALLFLTFYPSGFLGPSLILASMAVFFLLNWLADFLKIRELEGAVKSLRDSSDELIEQTNINYKNSLLINEIGQVLGKQLELKGLLDNISKVLEKRLDYDRGLIMLANHDRTKLVFQTGFGYTDKQLDILKDISFHLDSSASTGMFVVAFREQRPLLLNDIDDFKNDLSPKSYELALKIGAKSFICCPIIYEAESLGILAVDNLATKHPLLERDKNLLMGVTRQIGISIRNARLLDERLKQFESILQVLVATTDARDPITAGHSLKVTEYAVGICEALGFSPEYTDMLRVAALLHDYGKIGVEDEILKKPGRLSPEEYEAIKTHPAKSKRILEKITFEGIYQEVPEIVGAHHEKLDGTGYPKGLKDLEIPLGAKIIAVADAFESLTSRRQYRESILPHQALDKIVGRIDSYYDRRCVEALISYYNSQEARTPYIYKHAQ